MPGFKCNKCGKFSAKSKGQWCGDCKGSGTSTTSSEPEKGQVTKNEIKTVFGENSAKKFKGGEYLGGDANQLHVHVYSGNGAHVKCAGKTSIMLLNTGNNGFVKEMWDDIVAGVKQIKKGKGPGERSSVCGAAILLLLDQSDLTSTDLRVKMNALVEACK